MMSNVAFVQATITVRASDNPHGVVEFQVMSVSTDESSPAQLTIVRQFGTIGEHSLRSYTPYAPSLPPAALLLLLLLPSP